MKIQIFHSLAFVVSLRCAVNAHGSHGKAKDMPPDPDWATMHMAEEHHIANFDASTFFTLHDFNSDGQWDPTEVRIFYGFDSDGNEAYQTTEEHKVHAIRDVFALFDPDDTGVITRDQWMRHYAEGRRLPDFGLGPGHHGDDEYEYEIHHFEKYHGEDTKEEDLNHPEDIDHFKKHDRIEDEEERLKGMEKLSIVESNIPLKFRKQQ